MLEWENKKIMKKTKKLIGKKIVVVGGSRGICKAVSKAFLNEGASVILVARSKKELLSAKKELENLGKVHTFVADVSKTDQVKKLSVWVKSLWKNIDVLVNGAAISGPIGSVLENDPKKWEHSIRNTLLGTFHGIHFFGPMMVANKKGVIINFVGGGEGPFLNYTSYVAAKGGVMRLNETAAEELKKYGIRMNAIAPGAVNTQFLKDLLKAGPKKAGKFNYDRALKQKISGGVSPEKAAQLCVWLASNDSKGFTGKIFSAQWDPYYDLQKHSKDVTKTDVYTMRRIRPKDRKFTWDTYDQP